MKKRLTTLGIVLAMTVSAFAGPGNKLQFVGGITDPGLFDGEFPFSWPDTLFNQQTWLSQATCQDSCSSYQQIDGNDGSNYAALTQWISWCSSTGLRTTWYGGYIASADCVFDGMTVAQFTTYVETMSKLPGMQSPSIYINIANEPMHATGLSENNPRSQFIATMGGPGKTGYDWLVNIGNIFRKYFPNAKLGINDFSWESNVNDLPAGYGDGSVTYLSTWCNIVKAMKAANVLDWVGAEGYGLECVSSANLTAALNIVGALGVQIIITEFSPEAYNGNPTQSQQLSDWQRLLPLFAGNQDVIGVTGPWSFHASDQVGPCGIVNDTVSPVQYSSVYSWLKAYVPTIAPYANQVLWANNYVAWLKTLNTTEHPCAPLMLNWIAANPITGNGATWYTALANEAKGICGGQYPWVWSDYVPSYPFPAN